MTEALWVVPLCPVPAVQSTRVRYVATLSAAHCLVVEVEIPKQPVQFVVETEFVDQLLPSRSMVTVAE